MIANMDLEKTHHILLVEDNFADALLMRIAFQDSKFGAELKIVSDGEQALEFLHHEGKYAQEALPDMVLLDLNLPRMDGRTFLRRVREQREFENIKFIVLTSSRLETDIREVTELKVSDYLVKPIDLYGFFDLVRNLKKYFPEDGPV